jgi:hypothetical protein
MEKWLPVVGYEGLYEVSNTGKVMSLGRINNANKIKTVWPKKEIGLLTKRGYKVCHLTLPSQKSKQFLMHRLVMQAFIGEPPKGMEVCHNDGNPSNCDLSNLRYDTHKNNNIDRIKHKTIPKGQTHHKSKINENQALEIYSSNLKIIELSKIYGLSESSIIDIKKHRSWAWLTSLNKNLVNVA